ncbi:hypothetical protein DIPPA_24685 [Diplonema papillatum]|nr:hypothetical protein DIPPA_18571 [Diplonema papillatum]KAJ9441325.1 hypothetical protein DIPPA_13571 [Diplonema papillatum]KAJ9445343.1 hypothetical protein DIPPA_32439 [Diplonema papillatum]KAJ9454138.1 hypothetical protein DIPPA_34081 [Diplonema papillatum]KAJ9456736.1 hypothetical protein DIPPA_17833 [Diplonema papillatum]
MPPKTPKTPKSTPNKRKRAASDSSEDDSQVCVLADFVESFVMKKPGGVLILGKLRSTFATVTDTDVTKNDSRLVKRLKEKFDMGKLASSQVPLMKKDGTLPECYRTETRRQGVQDTLLGGLALRSKMLPAWAVASHTKNGLYVRMKAALHAKYKCADMASVYTALASANDEKLKPVSNPRFPPITPLLGTGPDEYSVGVEGIFRGITLRYQGNVVTLVCQRDVNEGSNVPSGKYHAQFTLPRPALQPASLHTVRQESLALWRVTMVLEPVRAEEGSDGIPLPNLQEEYRRILGVDLAVEENAESEGAAGSEDGQPEALLIQGNDIMELSQ